MMYKIYLTVTCILLFWSLQAQNHNPFQSIGKKGKILTLSDGKYEEIIEKDSLERIGTVMINRYTRKIERLLDEDSLQAVLTSTEQSRFLSVDPLTRQYAELTPYQFASNSPIANIDLDGKEAYWYKIDTDKKTGTTQIKLTDIKTSYLDFMMPYSMVISINGGEYKYSGSYWNFTDLNSYLSQIAKDPAPFYADLAKSQQSNVERHEKDKQEWENIFANAFTVAWGARTQKGTYTNIKAKGWENRLETYKKFSSNWSKGSLKESLNTLNITDKGVVSKDGVKTRFSNEKYEVIYDNENNYYRVLDKEKSQFVDKSGNLPSTQTLKGKEAKDHVQQQTHIKNE